jgi:hypothetical protein
MIGLNKIGLNQVQLNQLYLNTLCACQKSSGGDGFPHLRGDVTRWSFKGLTNEQMSKNPRLEDADHKGRFLTFKNFAWGGMSGCGGYSLSKETFSYTPDIYSFNFTDPEGGLKIFDVYFQLIGLEENSGVTFNLDIIESGTAKRIKRETYTKDGIYHFEYKSEDDAVRLYMIGYNGVGEDRTTFTVKILPYYAGALVFDGVDDYGICENFPILTKEKGYTVVALRKWLTPENKTNNEVLVANLKEPRWITENWGAFGCEVKYNNVNPKVKRTMSFGNTPVINVNENNVLLCQTSNNYNGVDIVSGNNTSGPYLLICSGGTSFFAKAAIWELIILDHDATEEELTKIKNYFIKTYPWLFFDQAWTVTGKTNEDEDRATIANITGNGNNLVLSNFGFAGNSGYGEYAYNWNTWKINKVDSTKSNVYHNRMEITLPAMGESSRTQCNFHSPLCEVGTIYDFSFKISGLTDNSTVFVKPGTNGGGAIIAQYNKDGVYHLNYTLTDEAIIGESTQNRIYFFIQKFSNEEMNLTVEQIPEYAGYLVTDGVDDTIASSAFKMGKDFTIIGEWKFVDNIIAMAGIVKSPSLFVYNTNNGLKIFINSTNKGLALNTKTLKAICSNGRVYSDDWSEMLVNEEQSITSSKSGLLIGINGNNFAKIALKNLAIYNQILSKDDCIKAYNYLQTLKAK